MCVMVFWSEGVRAGEGHLSRANWARRRMRAVRWFTWAEVEMVASGELR